MTTQPRNLTGKSTEYRSGYQDYPFYRYDDAEGHYRYEQGWTAAQNDDSSRWDARTLDCLN